MMLIVVTIAICAVFSGFLASWDLTSYLGGMDDE